MFGLSENLLLLMGRDCYLYVQIINIPQTTPVFINWSICGIQNTFFRPSRKYFCVFWVGNPLQLATLPWHLFLFKFSKDFLSLNVYRQRARPLGYSTYCVLQCLGQTVHGGARTNGQTDGQMNGRYQTYH